MAKEIHWRIPYTDANEVKHCINIYSEGTPIEVKTLIGGHIWDGGIMETSEAYSDIKFDTLRFQTGVIHIVNNELGLNLYDMMPIKTTDRPVQLIREPGTENEKVVWQGFLSPEGYTQEYINRANVIDFNIKSVLKALEDQPIEDDFRERYGELELNISDLIRLIIDDKLEKSGCPFSITGWHYPSEYRFFQDCHLMLGMFYEEKEDIQEDGSTIKKIGGRTIGEIIEEIGLYSCVAVREFGTEVYIQPISKNGMIDGISQTKLHMRDLSYKGDENTIKTDYPYKDLTLKLSPIKRESTIKLPDSSEINFNTEGVYRAPEQVSVAIIAWEYTKQLSFEIKDIYSYNTPFGDGIPVTSKFGGWFANDYTKCNGGNSLATEQEPNTKYAGAKLTKFRIREYFPENYDYNYGLGIIPYIKIIDSVPMKTYQAYKDVIARIYQPDYMSYDNINLADEVTDKWSIINIQGEVDYFYLDNNDGYIKNLPEDRHWSLLCYVFIEDQFGNKEYLTGYYENPQWSQERDILHLRMEGNKVKNNYNKNYHYFNKTDGYLVKFRNDYGRRKIKVTVELIASTALIEDSDGYVYNFPPCSLFMKEWKVEGIKEPSKNEVSEKIGRTRFRVLGGVEDHKNVTLKIMTNYLGGDNKHLSLLYKKTTNEEGVVSIQPASEIEYISIDGTIKSDRPENVLFERMYEHWSKPRRQIDLIVDTLDIPLPMIELEGYDGKRYIPLCEKRDYGTGISTITCFETE